MERQDLRLLLPSALGQDRKCLSYMCEMAPLAQGGESDSEGSRDGLEPGVCLAILAQDVCAPGWFGKWMCRASIDQPRSRTPLTF